MYTYIRLLFKYIYIYIYTCIYKVRDRDIVTVYDVVCQQKALKSCSSATVWESWLSEMTKQRERERMNERAGKGVKGWGRGMKGWVVEKEGAPALK